MKLLVLTSRYTASRDIISEDFGRQTRLFEALGKLNNKIDFFCADYNKLENKNLKLHGIDVSIRPFSFFYFFSFIKDLNHTLKNKKYDFLIATSDPLWGAVGYFFSRKYKIRLVYDLHDNYETYASYKMPFLNSLDKMAMKKSDIITTVSYALRNKILKIRKNKVFVIQNGVNLRIFKPFGRASSRKKLGLPLKPKIIAYTGSLQKSLGVGILINAFEKLRKEIPDAKLLLAGRLSKDKHDGPDIKKPGIISFDFAKQEKVALAISAADVAVIPSPSNEFTKYCFPYKCVEYMACNTPIVATRLSDVALMLKNYKDSLCQPGNEDELLARIKNQLNKKKIDYRKELKNFTWESIALKLDKILRKEMQND